MSKINFQLKELYFAYDNITLYKKNVVGNSILDLINNSITIFDNKMA